MLPFSTPNSISDFVLWKKGKEIKRKVKGKTSLWNDLNSLKKNRVKFKLPKEELALHRTLVLCSLWKRKGDGVKQQWAVLVCGTSQRKDDPGN